MIIEKMTTTDIAEEWAALVADLRETEPEEPNDPEWAQDLLSTWAGVARLRPGLAHAVLDPHDAEWLEETIRERGEAHAQLGAPGPDLEGWIEDLDELARSYDEEPLLEPAARARIARELLQALDHAELYRHAAQRLGVKLDQGEHESLLEECAKRCAELSGVFAAAEAFVRAAGEALRPDLAEQDPLLALTALKYVAVLDALVELRAGASTAGLPALDPAVARELISGLPSGKERTWPENVC